jgi:hypothetical protein
MRFASSKFRRPTLSGSMDRMPSGRRSLSGYSTRPVPIAQAGMRKMDAGQTSADLILPIIRKRTCPSFIDRGEHIMLTAFHSLSIA